VEEMNQTASDVYPEQALTLLVPYRAFADFGVRVKHKFDLHGHSG
jgi:hypothetical protein